MPVRNGKWVSYAELQEQAKSNDGKAPGPAETNDTNLSEKDKASRPKRSRSNAEAAVKDATGEDVTFNLPPDGGKQWTQEEGELAEQDSRAHSGHTVYRDPADQIAGRYHSENVEVTEPNEVAPGTTTSKSVKGLSNASEKAPSKAASKASEAKAAKAEAKAAKAEE